MLGELAGDGPVLGPVTGVVGTHRQLVDVQARRLPEGLHGEELDGEHPGHPGMLGDRAADELGLLDGDRVETGGRRQHLSAHAVLLNRLGHRPHRHLAAGGAGQQDGELTGEGDRLLHEETGHRSPSEAASPTGSTAITLAGAGPGHRGDPLGGLPLTQGLGAAHQQDPVTVITSARRLEHHGPAVLAGEGLNGVGHLLSTLLLRSADLRPGGLREPGPTHHPPHGELVARQGQGLRGGLDTDSLGLEPLQEGRVLVLVLEGEDRSRLPSRPVSTVPGDDGAHGRLIVGGPHGGVRGHLSGGPVRGFHQCPEVNTQSTGLLLHHAGQLPASDHGDDGCAHTPRLPAHRAFSPRSGPDRRVGA